MGHRQTSALPQRSKRRDKEGKRVEISTRPYRQALDLLTKHETNHFSQKKNPNLRSAQVNTPLLAGTLLSLEPRIMLDGAAMLTGGEVTAEATTDSQLDLSLSETSPDSANTTSTESLVESLVTGSTASMRKEIVFIDTRVEDYQTLMMGIDANAEVVLLDATRDGLQQIAEVLQGRSGFDAIHIVSHGDQGQLQVGTATLTLESMNAEYADELSAIGEALNDSADFLIYGCNYGEGETGQAAAARLAQLTGADVAASNDLTGSTALGGDWDLEVSTGQIETAVAFSTQVQQVWSGILADGDTTATFQEGVNGYASTEDTYLDENSPTTAYGTDTQLTADADVAGGNEAQALIKFDSLFGAGAGQIPLGATIISASLEFNVADSSVTGTTVNLYRMLTTWSESSTWNSMTNGIQTDGTDAASTADATVIDPTATGSFTVTGLESTLQAWSDGANNYGWVITNDNADNWDFSSSENITSNLRPKLIVEYRTSGGDTSTGLTGQWTFDANANDSSGNSYNGTLTGDASIDTTDLTDQVGAGKLSLDGTGDYVDLNSHVSNFNSLTEGTISAWIKTSTTGTAQTIFSLGDSNDANSFASLSINNTNALVWVVKENGTTLIEATSSITLTDGVWHHVTVAVNSSGNTLYIDGEVAEVTYTTGSASTTTFFDDVNTSNVMAIGREEISGGGQNYFNGLLDDIRVYNTALSVADIAAVAAEAPVATNDTAATTKDTAVNINLTANDTDLDSETITVLDVSNPTNGTVVNNGDGTGTYTPTTSYTGTDSFTYLTADLDDTVSYWRLDGNGTDAVASNDGTVTGTTTVAGVYGNALSFDEVDDNVVISDFAINNEFTLSFKFKIDDNTGSLFQYIFSYGAVGTANSLNVFLNEASHGTDPNMLRTNLVDTNDTGSDTALEFNIESIIGDGQWHTYTLTVAAGGGSKVYLDGVLKNSDTRGGDSFNPTTNIYFGAREDLDADRFYGGSLDSVQLFNRALNAEAVNDVHTGGSSLGTVSLNVSEAPTITNLAGDNLVYTEGDGAQVIDQSTAAVVADVDSSNFDTGTLTVSFTAGSDNAEDVLAIRNQGTGAGQIGVSGSTVTYAGVTIGTFTGGASGTNLVITLNSSADATATAALIQNITYENTDTNNPTLGTRTVRYVLTDGDGGTSANYDTTVTVSGQNDAPVLTPATPSLTSITEDDTSNSGDLISAIVGSSITDVDSGAIEGIAITSLSSSNGTWQYNTGSGWTDIGAVSNTSALLLRSTDNVRFVPDTQNSDSASITYRAWDQTTGTFGTKVTTASNGGATAFSTTTDTASITVTAENDAPVITSNGGGVSANVSIAEATTAVTTVTATDVDLPANTLTYSLMGGADAARFSINSSNGALTFSVAPDFENPADANMDNVYEVHVQVSDGNGGTDSQTIQVEVTNVVEAPPPPPDPPSEPPKEDPTPEENTPDSEEATESSSPSKIQGTPIYVISATNSEEQGEKSQSKDRQFQASGSDSSLLGSASPLEEGTLSPHALQALHAQISTRLSAFQFNHSVSSGDAFLPLSIQLDQLADRLQDAHPPTEAPVSLASGLATGTGITFSAGYVLWLLRSGSFLTTLMTTVNTWRNFDPLTVISAGGSAAELTADMEAENKEFQGIDDIFDKSSPK